MNVIPVDRIDWLHEERASRLKDATTTTTVTTTTTAVPTGAATTPSTTTTTRPRPRPTATTAVRVKASSSPETRVAVSDTSPPPAPTGVWDRIAACESGGDWHTATGNGYEGGLQMDQSFWDSYKPPGAPARASMATRTQQIAAATAARDSGRGYTPWPVCGRRR